MAKASLPRRIAKWSAVLVAIVLALLLTALVVLYFVSERIIERERIADGETVAVPTDAQSLTEGERLAHITGCTGCHSPDLGGGIFFDGGWLLGRIVAPNLTAVFRDASTEEIERAVRKGIGVDGRTLTGMPSGMYRNLSDEHLGRIFGWIRSRPVVERDLPESRLGPMARMMIVTGAFELDADVVDRLGLGDPKPILDNPAALGKYMAHIACTECHGHDLRGGMPNAPHLGIARSYTPEQFAHLMRTGEALGGRELELMSGVARSRFSRFTDEEIHALHTYLSQLAESP